MRKKKPQTQRIYKEHLLLHAVAQFHLDEKTLTEFTDSILKPKGGPLRRGRIYILIGGFYLWGSG